MSRLGAAAPPTLRNVVEANAGGDDACEVSIGLTGSGSFPTTAAADRATAVEPDDEGTNDDAGPPLSAFPRFSTGEKFNVDWTDLRLPPGVTDIGSSDRRPSSFNVWSASSTRDTHRPGARAVTNTHTLHSEGPRNKRSLAQDDSQISHTGGLEHFAAGPAVQRWSLSQLGSSHYTNRPPNTWSSEAPVSPPEHAAAVTGRGFSHCIPTAQLARHHSFAFIRHLAA